MIDEVANIYFYLFEYCMLIPIIIYILYCVIPLEWMWCIRYPSEGNIKGNDVSVHSVDNSCIDG